MSHRGTFVSLPDLDPARAHRRPPPCGGEGMTALSLPGLSREGRSALRAGVVGNWIDNIHVFLPLTALAPAMGVLAGPTATASTGALIVVAMLFGRPVGGMGFGRIADRIGRTKTTRRASGGTAGCWLRVAANPAHDAARA